MTEFRIADTFTDSLAKLTGAVINRSSLAALGANRPAVAARFNVNDQGFHAIDQLDEGGAVNE